MDFWTRNAKASTSGQHELWSVYVVQRGGLGKSLEGRGRILVLFLNLTTLAALAPAFYRIPDECVYQRDV